MTIRCPWIVDESLVLVVAAGQGAREQALRFSIYHSQNHRTFKPSKYIAFYSSGCIDTYAEIIGPPEDDVIISEKPDLRELARIMPESNGNPCEPHCLFRLGKVQIITPIVNTAKDWIGKTTPWTQKQRYTTIESLLTAKTTSEL